MIFYEIFWQIYIRIYAKEARFGSGRCANRVSQQSLCPRVKLPQKDCRRARFRENMQVSRPNATAVQDSGCYSNDLESGQIHPAAVALAAAAMTHTHVAAFSGIARFVLVQGDFHDAAALDDLPLACPKLAGCTTLTIAWDV